LELDYTVRTGKSQAGAVQAVLDCTAARGFRVQFVHDVQETLAEKGFSRAPLTIVEICNAKYASQVLAADPKIGLMLPCPIMVYVDGDETLISTMRPTLIGGFFPGAGIEDVAAEVESIIVGIIDEAAA
jgi:uncharacterized protein (DUF302 family)